MSKIYNKRLLLIITEGPTETEFYKQILNKIREVNKLSKFNFDKIDYFCASGIAKMSTKMFSKFKKEYCIDEYVEYEKIVCFCYDNDVFKRKKENPPIDRKKMESDFKQAGADRIINIIADDMIEDFFLYDIVGIKKYLKLKKSYRKTNKKSLELLQQMFKDSNKIYTKGVKVEGLVDALNIELILLNICCQIKPLCIELGCSCDGTKCKK